MDLPQPDSPATPTISPASHRQVDPAHRGQRTLRGRVGDVEVADGEQGRARVIAAPCSRGLRTSSSACPTRVNARTTRTTQTPGGMTYHQQPVVIAPTW